MFKTDNTKIGNYLAALIKNSKYKNDRQFSIAYLTLRDGAANPDDIQNMQNRICQIKKGKKGVLVFPLRISSVQEPLLSLHQQESQTTPSPIPRTLPNGNSI